MSMHRLTEHVHCWPYVLIKYLIANELMARDNGFRSGLSSDRTGPRSQCLQRSIKYLCDLGLARFYITNIWADPRRTINADKRHCKSAGGLTLPNYTLVPTNGIKSKIQFVVRYHGPQLPFKIPAGIQ